MNKSAFLEELKQSAKEDEKGNLTISKENIEKFMKRKKRKNNGFTYEQNFNNKFNEDPNYQKTIREIIGIDSDEPLKVISTAEYNKVNNTTIENNPEFNRIKNESGSSETSSKSKTDLIVVNTSNNTIVRKISLKAGEGRLTSGDAHEIRALFLTTMNKLNQNEKKSNILKQKTLDFLNAMPKKKIVVSSDLFIKDLKKNKENDDVNQIQTEIDNCNKKFQELCTTPGGKEYLQKIVEEMMFGTNKFETNSIACADCFLKINKKTYKPELCIMKTEKDKIKKFFEEYFKKKFYNKTPIAWKSSKVKKGRKAWVRFL